MLPLVYLETLRRGDNWGEVGLGRRDSPLPLALWKRACVCGNHNTQSADNAQEKPYAGLIPHGWRNPQNPPMSLTTQNGECFPGRHCELAQGLEKSHQPGAQVGASTPTQQWGRQVKPLVRGERAPQRAVLIVAAAHSPTGPDPGTGSGQCYPTVTPSFTPAP